MICYDQLYTTQYNHVGAFKQSLNTLGVVRGYKKTTPQMQDFEMLDVF